MQIGDLHIHTKYSKDANIEPLHLIKKAKKLGFSVLGITDHNEVKGGLYAKKENPYRDILILVGQEVKTERGEVIVFGCKENLYGKSFFEIIDFARDNNYLTILPHPFDGIRRNGVGRFFKERELKEIVKKVDAIECLNSRCIFNLFNEKAKKFAKENLKPCVAGTDAHTLEEFGVAKTFIESELKEEEIFEAIRRGKTSIEGKINIFSVHFKSFLIKLSKRKV